MNLIKKIRVEGNLPNSSVPNSDYRKRRNKNNKPLSYKIYLPENLNLDDILTKHPPLFNRLPLKYRNYRDSMAYILHLINSIPNSKKDFDYEKEQGFIPINKKLLSKRIHEYRAYINYLKRYGIIEEGTSYQVGIRSMGLRFTPKYRTKVKVEYITTPTLIKNILSRKANRDINAEEKLMFLKGYLNSCLTIDINEALIELEKDKVNSRNKHIAKRQTINYSNEELLNLPSIDDVVLMGFNSKYITVEKINSADYRDYPKIDSTTGRLHSPFVLLYKKLRKFLKYNNQKLANIDIVNSQPFLSLILLDINLFERMNIKSLIAKYNPLFKSSQYINEDNNVVIVDSKYSTMVVNMIKKFSSEKDVVDFKKSVISGTYYEDFAKILIDRNLIPTNILSIQDENERLEVIRKFAKNATFRALFEKVNARRWSEYVRAFADCFPNVFKIFQFVKKGKNNHSTLACMLQRFESYLVLHNVCVDIHKNYPDIPIFTIHDSIATTESNSEIVLEIFKKNLQKIMGITPSLNVDIWE